MEEELPEVQEPRASSFLPGSIGLPAEFKLTGYSRLKG